MILEAAAAQFAADSYDRVKISDISRRAEASDALIYRYFRNKEGLYDSVLEASLAELNRRCDLALAEMPPNSPRRERIRAIITVHLDHLAGVGAPHPLPASATEPASATGIRARFDAEIIALIRRELSPSTQVRHEYALHGFLGFLHRACTEWVKQGSPVNARQPLTDACLGALEGALGDWSA